MIVPFSTKALFSLETKRMPERVFWFDVEGEEKQLSVSIEQSWEDDGRGGTELGFGAAVYESAFVLAEFICHNPDLVKGHRVVELGAGTGLVSVVCAKLGASSVVATDGDSVSAELSAKNLSKNDCDASSSGAVVYLWGEDPAPLGQVDIVVGSDIIAFPYVKSFPLLLESMNRLTSNNKGVCFLIAYKPRGAVEAKFFESVKAAGFVIEQMQLLGSDFEDSEIQLLKMIKG